MHSIGGVTETARQNFHAAFGGLAQQLPVARIGAVTGDSADPRYGELLRQATKSGVEVLPCCFSYTADAVHWQGTRLVHLD